MAKAFIGEANFVLNGLTQTPHYIGTVIYEMASGRYNESSVDVLVSDTETAATFQPKLLAAVDAEAVRIGLSAPTLIFGSALTRFR